MNLKYKNLKTVSTSTINSLVIVMLLILTSCNTDETQVVAKLSNLVMEDEFEADNFLNPQLWTYNIGTGQNGWGNNELQYYTDSNENVKVENGMLYIIANKENFQGSSYTSGRILTKGLFEQKYGRIEAKIKLPWGQGIWPAFWMLGANSDEVIWPQCGEIDIMEFRGQEPTKIAGSVHGPGYSAGNAVTKEFELENDRFDTGFHVFGIEWGEDYINYYVDDVLYNQITPDDVSGEWVFNQPFYIILNVAVGGNYVGSPNTNTVFPQTMIVDYIRVYE